MRKRRSAMPRGAAISTLRGLNPSSFSVSPLRLWRRISKKQAYTYLVRLSHTKANEHT